MGGGAPRGSLPFLMRTLRRAGDRVSDAPAGPRTSAWFGASSGLGFVHVLVASDSPAPELREPRERPRARPDEAVDEARQRGRAASSGAAGSALGASSRAKSKHVVADPDPPSPSPTTSGTSRSARRRVGRGRGLEARRGDRFRRVLDGRAVQCSGRGRRRASGGVRGRGGSRDGPGELHNRDSVRTSQRLAGVADTVVAGGRRWPAAEEGPQRARRGGRRGRGGRWGRGRRPRRHPVPCRGLRPRVSHEAKGLPPLDP